MKVKYGPNGTVGPAPGFTWDEARCRDGWLPRLKSLIGHIVLSSQLLNQLRTVVARHYGVPAKNVFIVVNSWARSDPYNKNLEKGGAATLSYHTRRRPVGYRKGCSAVDIQVLVKTRSGKLIKLKPQFVARLAEKLPQYRNGGIGVYATFTHLDHRGYKSRWWG